MGMFSIREGREINEVNGLRAAQTRLHRGQRRQPAKSELDTAIGKLSTRELQLLLHFGAEVYVEIVREVDADLADRMDGEMSEAIRTTKQLPQEEQELMAGRAVSRAKESVAILMKSGKL